MDTDFTTRMQRFLERAKQPPRRTAALLLEGAELLLRINRNRILHRNILARRLWDKLIYELRKHLRYRLDGLTRADLATYEQSVMPVIERTARLAAQYDALSTHPRTAPADPTDPVPAAAQYDALSTRPRNAPTVPAAPATPASSACSVEGATEPAPRRGLRPDHAQLPPALQAIPARNAERIKKMAALHAHLRTLQNAQPCDRYEYIRQLVDLDRRYHTDWQRYDDYAPPPFTAPPPPPI